MLKILRRGQRWIIWAVVLLVGGVFVLFFGPWDLGAGTSGPSAVVQVDDVRFWAADVLRVREQHEQRVREALGDAYNARAMQDQLDSLATNVIVNRAVLVHEAQRLGLHVGDREVEQTIRALPGFRDVQGKIGREAAIQSIEYEYGSVKRFKEAVRTDLAVQKLLRLLGSSVQVSEAEARDAVFFRLEEIRLAYVALDDTPPPDLEVSDEQVTALLTGDEPRVRALYAERIDQYDVPEQVRARHVLLRIPPEASEEQVAEVRARIEALRARIEAGEEFAAVAEAESEDPGTRPAGGDLGFFGRGQMVPPFEEVAFAAAPGALSEPVRTDFGFHLILVEEHREAKRTEFEEVREALARELLVRDAAAEHAQRVATTLQAEIRAGSSLEDAARKEGLTLERTGWVTRRPDGFLTGLGASQDLMNTAFALTPEHATSGRLFDVDGKRVLIQLLERKLPDAETLAREVPQAREELLTDKRQRVQSEWIDARRTALLEEGSLRVDLAALRP